MSDDPQQSPAPQQKPKVLINPPVFFTSVAIIAAMVLFSVIVPETAETVFDNVKARVISDAGWFYVLTVAIIITLVTFLAVSRFGDIKLGKDHSEPDYSYGSWFAMLFSAGMGIGLMFFGVAEPVTHFTAPPMADPGTIAAAKEAMRATFFHWGLHAWSIYAIVGLILAYFSFRHGLPLTLRSALYPLIGKKIYGPLGHAVDIFAVVGTVFGVATSLGFGVEQVNAGLNYLFGLPKNEWVQVGLIVAITGLATISVVTGLDAGIRRLSELNLGLAFLLLAFVLFLGPTVFLLKAYVQNLGDYLSELVSMTFNLYTYQPKVEDGPQDWMGGWTLFYWGWWISWSPFVGMFIARVSYGRSVREFLTAVLLVPTLVTVVWMATFGGSGLHQTINGIGELANGVGDSSLALFQMLAELPLTAITSFLAIVLVLVFFITSSDSGSLVIDSITAGGKLDAPVPQRVFWAIMEGLIAGALLYGGGEQALNALQAGAITTGLPFTVVLLVMCFSLYKGLSAERKLMTANP